MSQWRAAGDRRLHLISRFSTVVALAVAQMKRLLPRALVTHRPVPTVRFASRRSVSQTSGGVKTWIFCQRHPQLRHPQARGRPLILRILGGPPVLLRSAPLQGRQVCSEVRCHVSGCQCLRQVWHHQCQRRCHSHRPRHRRLCLCPCQSRPLSQQANQPAANRKALRSPSLDVPTLHLTSGQRRCQCQRIVRRQL